MKMCQPKWLTERSRSVCVDLDCVHLVAEVLSALFVVLVKGCTVVELRKPLMCHEEGKGERQREA